MGRRRLRCRRSRMGEASWPSVRDGAGRSLSFRSQLTALAARDPGVARGGRSPARGVRARRWSDGRGGGRGQSNRRRAAFPLSGLAVIAAGHRAACGRRFLPAVGRPRLIRLGLAPSVRRGFRTCPAVAAAGSGTRGDVLISPVASKRGVVCPVGTLHGVCTRRGACAPVSRETVDRARSRDSGGEALLRPPVPTGRGPLLQGHRLLRGARGLRHRRRAFTASPQHSVDLCCTRVPCVRT